MPEAQGVDRARSACEAFSFRRRQTRRGSSVRLRLNAKRPIPFGPNGCVEVDLLCEDGRLVIELGGAQHLADPEAYRRDRRKDASYRNTGISCCAFWPLTSAGSATTSSPARPPRLRIDCSRAGRRRSREPAAA